MASETGLLDRLGLHHGTDKSSQHHDFLSLYERFLAPLRLEQVRMLEIGVLGGNSLRMWRDYFPLGTVVGVDIEPNAKVHAMDRTPVEIADQSDPAQLSRLATDHGPFDIVLDDGSHQWKHQITTLQTLLPAVKPGGYYILEDLDTSYGRYIPHYGDPKIESAARYLQRLSDCVVGDTALDMSEQPDTFFRSHARRIGFILLARRTAIIQVRPA